MSSRPILVAGFAAAAAVRLAYLATSPENWDTQAYDEVIAALDSGGALYRDTPRYNYAPVWALVLRGLSKVAGPAGIPLRRAVGGLLLAGDAVAAWLVFRIARDVLRRSSQAAAGAALLFFANPVSVFVTGFHAQFDGLAILLLLAAIWLEGRPPVTRTAAAGALAGSLLVKHVAAFHPLLWTRRWKALVLIPYLAFLASFLPYWRERDAVAARVFGYGSLAEDYGTAMLRKLPGVPDWAPRALFFAAVIGAAFALSRLEPARASLLLFLVLLIFLPGIAQYYLVWPIALGSLFRGAGYAVYTLVVSAFFLGSPDGLGLEFEHFPGWHGIWWSAVFWLLWELRGLSKGRPR